MKCPNCNEVMEREDIALVEQTSLKEYRRTKSNTKLIPGAHYYCSGCDSEWCWIRGVKGILQIDGRDYIQP